MTKKIKVLWIVNFLPDPLAIKLNKDVSASGSWIKDLSENIASNPNIELHILSPYNKTLLYTLTESHIRYHTVKTNRINKEIAVTFCYRRKALKILKKIKPNVVHYQGSEFPFINAFIRKKSNEVLSVQGLISEINNKVDFFGNLTKKELKIKNYQVLYAKYIRNIFRSRYEIKNLKSLDNIIGRTFWDKKIVERINPNASYYTIQELMRNDFFGETWEYAERNKIVIFAAGGFSSPLKGFHLIIDLADKLVKNRYDVEIKVPGESFMHTKSNGYLKYLKEKVLTFNLQQSITFLGKLNSEEMVYHFKDSSMYIMGSYIENSSNTLGEAILLGVPSIVPFVGGIPSIAEEEGNVLYYEKGNLLSLYHKVTTIIDKKHKIKKISSNAKKRGLLLYDKDKIISDLLKLYFKLAKES